MRTAFQALVDPLPETLTCADGPLVEKSLDPGLVEITADPLGQCVVLARVTQERYWSAGHRSSGLSA